jgi:hypothetical protein
MDRKRRVDLLYLYAANSKKVESKQERKKRARRREQRESRP